MEKKHLFKKKKKKKQGEELLVCVQLCTESNILESRMPSYVQKEKQGCSKENAQLYIQETMGVFKCYMYHNDNMCPIMFASHELDFHIWGQCQSDCELRKLPCKRQMSGQHFNIC